MNLRRIIPTDITVSAIVHLSLLTLLLLFSEVHQFGSVTAETMAVEIVAPQDIPQEPATEKQPEPIPTPTPLPDFSLLDTKPATPSAVQPAAKSQPAARQQKQAALAPPPPQQQAAPSPPAAQPQQQAATAYQQPEPDLTIKYQVLLGLPPDLSPTLPAAPSPQARAKSDDNFDGAATQDADIASNVVAAFRRHLKTCLKLPPALAASDDVKVKLRVMMTQRGTLAADPILIEASASMKGPLLMQGAVKALQACQPYAMLPADRYGEWKVLDLSFTPQDFGGAS
jgi:outer membrane biosynthesis protein TonB